MKIKEKVYITNNSAETKKLGRDFAKALEKGDLVCLYGDLGSGKTTFAQGLAQGLEIKEKIISPTFIIVRCYELQTQNSKLKSLEAETFYHIDLYRMESVNDLRELGLEEILENQSSITAIEWAEKMKDLPEKRIDIKFAYEGENKRKISFALGF